MNECQGTPWSEELDGNELHEAVGGDLERRKFAVSCTSSIRRQDINSTSIFEYDIMLFLVGGISYVFFLLPDRLFAYELYFRTLRLENIVSLNPRIALLSQRVLFFQGG